MKLKRKLIVLVTVFSICSSGIAKENEPIVSCDVVLNACVEFSAACDAERKACQNVIKRQDDKIQELQKDAPVAWYWYALGGLVGGFAIQGALR